jgi:hypothetical protein
VALARFLLKNIISPTRNAAMPLSTHLRRSLFALPLLAVGLAGLASAERPVPPAPSVLEAWQADAGDCGASPRPVGALGLARMPGDLTAYARRLRCAG